MTTENNVKTTDDKANWEAANKFRYEVAGEIGVPRHYAGGGTKYGSAGFKSGYLMQRIIEAQEKQMSNQGK